MNSDCDPLNTHLLSLTEGRERRQMEREEERREREERRQEEREARLQEQRERDEARDRLEREERDFRRQHRGFLGYMNDYMHSIGPVQADLFMWYIQEQMRYFTPSHPHQ